eukprot:PLAT10034.1.p1 GENE.PLAT10034.1~~PLAT10034.1.p1  ORF type:complete len:611 (+),score=129.26 PLAT10034.1:36-1835(+)
MDRKDDGSPPPLPRGDSLSLLWRERIAEGGQDESLLASVAGEGRDVDEDRVAELLGAAPSALPHSDLPGTAKRKLRKDGSLRSLRKPGRLSAAEQARLKSDPRFQLLRSSSSPLFTTPPPPLPSAVKLPEPSVLAEDQSRSRKSPSGKRGSASPKRRSASPPVSPVGRSSSPTKPTSLFVTDQNGAPLPISPLADFRKKRVVGMQFSASTVLRFPRWQPSSPSRRKRKQKRRQKTTKKKKKEEAAAAKGEAAARSKAAVKKSSKRQQKGRKTKSKRPATSSAAAAGARRAPAASAGKRRQRMATSLPVTRGEKAGSRGSKPSADDSVGRSLLRRPLRAVRTGGERMRPHTSGMGSTARRSSPLNWNNRLHPGAALYKEFADDGPDYVALPSTAVSKGFRFAPARSPARLRRSAASSPSLTSKRGAAGGVAAGGRKGAVRESAAFGRVSADGRSYLPRAHSPGPVYNVGLPPSARVTPAVHIRARPKDSMAMQTPGPGAYYRADAVTRVAAVSPSYSFATSARPVVDAVRPPKPSTHARKRRAEERRAPAPSVACVDEYGKVQLPAKRGPPTVDGLRPDALRRFVMLGEAPELDALMSVP